MQEVRENKIYNSLKVIKINKYIYLGFFFLYLFIFKNKFQEITNKILLIIF